MKFISNLTQYLLVYTSYIYILYNIAHNTHMRNNPNIVFHLFSIQNKQLVVGLVT